MKDRQQSSNNSIELLTFQLGDQEYSLDIMSVREIRGWARTTPLPHAPNFMKGVINLRGTVLPVMDLSQRLGLEARAHTNRNVIIVVKYEDVMTGLLVDAVSDIIALSDDDLQPPPDLSGSPSPNVVRALTLVGDRMIRVLDLAAIVTPSQIIAA
ncbi:chemotaxis protein CheW [Sulfitobacter sabulilitoris]|uniref:Purine-binding chemotaxis protein CheW n=1 Tax=Sulfitobacter sabulilitoris TaxID=2562655 RepID=A0A5S3PK86_9RHOB|nr:chemotaxis protein CheW [Sulfitobacter sabulilitoris]TMM54666.1 purine-binding chemotaxis protein CheW [Sulfitobacter sabulilitoris]